MNYYHPRFLFRRYEIMKNVKRGESFLEIGPGNLGLALDLTDYFKTGTLIDFNTSDVECIYNALSDSYKQRLKLIIADFMQYNQIESKFDCVIACEVLEHIEDDRLFLKRVSELMKNDGQLILSVPARQKYWSVDDEIVGHYRRYEKQELQEKIIGAGYSQIKIISYGYPFQNLIRMLRIALARFQFREKSGWERKKQSQQSAFLIKRKSYTRIVSLALNKYTLYPACLLSSLFNNRDLGEGYVISAFKKAF